jgi:hypothetical protein
MINGLYKIAHEAVMQAMRDEEIDGLDFDYQADVEMFEDALLSAYDYLMDHPDDFLGAVKVARDVIMKY